MMPELEAVVICCLGVGLRVGLGEGVEESVEHIKRKKEQWRDGKHVGCRENR